MMALSAFCLSVLVFASCLLGISAHGGGLHTWLFTPSSSSNGTRPLRTHIRYEVGSCDSFEPVASNVSLLGILPYFPRMSSANASVNVRGSVRLWYYQSNNCSDSPNSALEADLLVTKPDGTPYAGRSVAGYGFTGSCANPGNLYRHDAVPARPEERFNIHWWYYENAAADATGAVWGTAPNSWYMRMPGASGSVVQSVILFPSPSDSLPLCCNVKYNAPPPTTWYSLGRICKPAPPPSPSPPSPPPKKHAPPPPRKRPPPPKKKSPSGRSLL